MALDVAVYDSEVMHIEINPGALECDFDSEGHREVDVALHVQRREQAVVHELIDDHDVWDGGAAAHQQGDIGVPQDALHHNLVLNLREQLVGDAWVEDFLYRDGRAVQAALVDHRKTALADLLAHFDVAHGDFAHARHGRQSARRRRDFSRAGGE